MTPDGGLQNPHFPKLFATFHLRGKTFKNRLFLAAHGTGYSKGTLSERAMAYYQARLEGGVSLIVTEGTQVVPMAGQGYAQLNGSDDRFIDEVAKLKTLCADHDARVFVQFYHEGRARAHSVDGSVEVALAPTAARDERFHVVPKAMSVEDIHTLTRHFADAAGRAAAGGADGVELLVGMGYLHGQFLSPSINDRTDDYGGSAGNRLRFLVETLQEMRVSMGDDPILGIRIVPEDDDPDGLRLKDSLPACTALAEKGLIDYISVTVGSTHGLAGTANIVPSMFSETGVAERLADQTRRATGLPVFVTGRINQPHLAEAALAQGQADMVGLVRALLTDPDFPMKAREGRAEEIRACIACNQACIGHRNQGHGVSCIQFPESGRELEYRDLAVAEVAKSVLVVGGGPGGMKAAIVSAQRGHKVVLMERGSRLGGQALLAQMLPGRAEFGGIITNLQGEAERLGVDVRLNCEATPDLVADLAPDAVVLATGARPHMPHIELDGAHFVQAWDVIQDRINLGSHVVITDWRCDWVGPGVAEILAARGHKVTLAVNGEMAGQSIQKYVRYQIAGRLHQLGVDVIPYMRVFGADEDSVYLQHVVTGAPHVIPNADTLVLASGGEAEGQLAHDLGRLRPDLPLYMIGDCVSPRTAEEAVLEGLKTAALI